MAAGFDVASIGVCLFIATAVSVLGCYLIFKVNALVQNLINCIANLLIVFCTEICVQRAIHLSKLCIFCLDAVFFYCCIVFLY